MITVEQYFAKPRSADQEAAATDLLQRVNELLADAYTHGVYEFIDPDTGSQISGTKGGSGDGGFRLPDSKTGPPGSSHRQAMAVDVYDPTDELDTWLDEFERDGGQNSMLEKHGLYREHPSATNGWCHLSTRAPRSGKRTFLP